MSEIAKVLGYPEDIKKYNNILQRGKRAYERKLWNGRGINTYVECCNVNDWMDHWEGFRTAVIF